MANEILYSLSLHLGCFPESLTLREKRARVLELLMEQKGGTLQEWNELLDFLFATGQRFGSLSQVHVFLEGKMRNLRAQRPAPVDEGAKKMLP